MNPLNKGKNDAQAPLDLKSLSKPPLNEISESDESELEDDVKEQRRRLRHGRKQRKVGDGA